MSSKSKSDDDCKYDEKAEKYAQKAQEKYEKEHEKAHEKYLKDLEKAQEKAEKYGDEKAEKYFDKACDYLQKGHEKAEKYYDKYMEKAEKYAGKCDDDENGGGDQQCETPEIPGNTFKMTFVFVGADGQEQFVTIDKTDDMDQTFDAYYAKALDQIGRTDEDCPDEISKAVAWIPNAESPSGEEGISYWFETSNDDSPLPQVPHDHDCDCDDDHDDEDDHLQCAA